MSHVRENSPFAEHGTIVEIRTTFSRHDEAASCATRLVAEHLAACVQIEGPLTSIYRWRGEVETAEEFRCTCKTSPARAEACAAAVLASHDYKTPELVVTFARASVAYAEWVRESVETTHRHGGRGDASEPA